MATLKITPARCKASQLESLLTGRLSGYVYGFTRNGDGTITLRGNMAGILTDVERTLAKEGLLVQSSTWK